MEGRVEGYLCVEGPSYFDAKITGFWRSNFCEGHGPDTLFGDHVWRWRWPPYLVVLLGIVLLTPYE